MSRTRPTDSPKRIQPEDAGLVGGEVQRHHLPIREPVRIRKWSIDVIDCPEGIDRIESDWRRLTPKTAVPFVTFSWNRAWFRVYGESLGQPLIFQIRENGETTAILPCYRKGKVFRLAGDNVCDYQDIVTLNEESAKMAISIVLLWLQKNAKQFHFYFEKLSSEGQLYRALSERRDDSNSILFEKRYAPCPRVNLRGGLENYLTSLPRKMRGDLRRALNRLEREAPTARVTISRDLGIRAGDLERAAAFHSEYFRKDGRSPLADQRLVSLLGEVAKDPDVGLHLSHFSDQSETLAVDFGFARGGRYFGYLTGFNPDFRKLAPGKCLLLTRIDRWVAEDGVEILDFLAGDEKYKKGFTGGEEYHVNSVRLMRKTPAWSCLKFILEADKKARSLAKSVLRRAGFIVG